MKKILAGLLVCVMALSVAGCGSDKKDDKDTNKTKVEKSEKTSPKTSAKTSEKASEKPQTTEYANPEDAIKAYIQKGIDSGQVAKLVQAYQTRNIAIEVVARGNAMVYKSMFTTPVPANAAQEIEADIIASEAVLKAKADAVRKQEPAIKSVVYEFYDMNSALLYVIEF